MQTMLLCKTVVTGHRTRCLFGGESREGSDSDLCIDLPSLLEGLELMVVPNSMAEVYYFSSYTVVFLLLVTDFMTHCLIRCVDMKCDTPEY